MKRFLAIVITFMIVVVFITGCRSDSEADSQYLPGGTGVPIIVYSNSLTPERHEWLITRAAEDGFVIIGEHAGGGATVDRMIEERAAPRADVVFGLNVFLWQRLIDYNLIVPFTPSWAAEIPLGLNHPEGYFHAIVVQAILLVYDTATVSVPPTDWLDLWTDEQFHGRYQVETALTGGTTRMVIAGVLGRFLDPYGFLGVSDEGWNHLEQFFARGYPNFDRMDLFEQMANPYAPVAMGQKWHAGIPSSQEDTGVTVGWAVPAVGVPFVVEGIAEVYGTENPVEARRFIEWFGSAQIQQEWSEMFDTLPANINAIDDLSDFALKISTLPIQVMNWDFVAANFDAWAEHIYANFIPTP